jgi:hypothetical protein
MIDMTNNRVPYGLLTDEEKAVLHEHEKAGGVVSIHLDQQWVVASKAREPWAVYRTVPLPAQRSEQSSLKTQDVTEYEKGLNDALACIASLGYGRSDDVDHGHDEAFRAVAKCRDDWKAGATKKTQDVIAWDRLPDRIEWVARWENGMVWGYVSDPSLQLSGWYGLGGIRIDDFPGIVQIGTCYWKDSKQRRPRG